MFRIDSDSVSPTLPTPSSVGATVGYFTEGDPGVGILGTKVSADWLNAVQEEISGVIEGAGLSLDKTDPGQLHAAIDSLIASNAIGGTLGTEPNRVPVSDGTGGSTLQASQVEINSSGEMGNVARMIVGGDLGVLESTAAFQIDSTTGGFLLPRLTVAEKTALSSPPDGMLVYDSTNARVDLRQGGGWATVLTASEGVYYVSNELSFDAALTACAGLGGGQIILTADFTIETSKTVPSNTVVIGRKAASVLTFSLLGSLELEDEAELRDVTIESALPSGTLVETVGDRVKIQNCKFTVDPSSTLTCVLLSGDFGTVFDSNFNGVSGTSATGIDFGSGYENVEERNLFA
jgi:hypothetical protein